MVAVHVALGIAVIATNLVAGGWGGTAWLRQRRRSASGTRCASPRGGGAPGDLGAVLLLSAARAAASTTSTACCRYSSRCSPRRPAPEPPSASSTGPRLRLAAKGPPAADRARDRPPRDRDHGRLGAGHLPARAAGATAALAAAERPVLAAVKDQRLAAALPAEVEHPAGRDRVVAAVVESPSSQASQIDVPSIRDVRALAARRPRPTSPGAGPWWRSAGRASAWSAAEHVDRRTGRRARPRPACASRGRARRASAAAPATARRRRWRSRPAGPSGRRGDDGDPGREARHRRAQGGRLVGRHQGSRLAATRRKV